MFTKISLLLPLLFVCLFSTNAFALSNVVNKNLISNTVRNTAIGIVLPAKVYTYKHTKVDILIESGKFKGCSASGSTYISASSLKALVSINKINCANKSYNRKGFALFSRKIGGLKVIDIKQVKVKNKLKTELSGTVKEQNINLIILN
ncbi:MAG: hypothetical protein ACYDDE_00450 [bacterium]